VGVIISQYGLWQALVRVPLGVAADSVGWRKPFIIGGLVVVGLGALTTGLATGAGGLLVGRALVGIGAGTWVLLVVAFNSLFSPEEAVRATTVLNLVGAAARLIATASTGYLNQLGGYLLAFLLAAVAAAGAIVSVLPVRESRFAPRRRSAREIANLVSRRDVLLPALLSAVIQYFNWTAALSFLPLLADQMGGGGVTLSMLASVGVGMSLIGTLVATAIVSRIGARRLVVVGFVMLSTGLAVSAVAASLPAVFLAQVCVTLSVGAVYPVLMGMSIRHVDDTDRNTAMGLHQSVYAFGMFAGPWVSGILADAIGMRPMFGASAVACLVIGLFTTFRLMAREGD
jgi:MFS family permease